jgi:hypothetical protein
VSIKFYWLPEKHTFMEEKRVEQETSFALSLSYVNNSLDRLKVEIL